MSIFFTSDIHFGHTNIIKYCNRPFTNVQEMDEKIIQNWNKTVSPYDTTYIVGDFSFHKDQQKTISIINRLNGSKHLIMGNHDKDLKSEVLSKFASVHDYFELNMAPDNDYPRGHMIVLLHYAMRVWNKSHRGSWHLYGHSHGTLYDDNSSLSIDVGLDCHNYMPISYDDVKKIMSYKKYKPIDRHGEV